MVWRTIKLQQLSLLVISSEVTELWDKHRTEIEYNLSFGVSSTSSTAKYSSSFQVPSSSNLQLNIASQLPKGILQSIYSFESPFFEL